MAEQVVFTPKESFSDPDSLGTIWVSDEGDLNVREAVADGKGYIVAEDPDLVAALDRYSALKRASMADVEKAHKQKAPPKGAKPTGDDK